MKLLNLTTGLIVTLLLNSTGIQAQQSPGTGAGCDALCGTIYQNGIPVGHGCVGGGDRNRTNCVATENDCTTDPCGGFALVSSSGRLLAVGTCAERSIVESAPLEVIKIAFFGRSGEAAESLKAPPLDLLPKKSRG
jgi:hypothetical protein